MWAHWVKLFFLLFLLLIWLFELAPQEWVAKWVLGVQTVIPKVKFFRSALAPYMSGQPWSGRHSDPEGCALVHPTLITSHVRRLDKVSSEGRDGARRRWEHGELWGHNFPASYDWSGAHGLGEEKIYILLGGMAKSQGKEQVSKEGIAGVGFVTSLQVALPSFFF